MILKERPRVKEPVFIGTLRGCKDIGEGRKVAELGLKSCNEREPGWVVKDAT